MAAHPHPTVVRGLWVNKMAPQPTGNPSAHFSRPHSLALSTSLQRNVANGRRKKAPPQAPSPPLRGSSVGPTYAHSHRSRSGGVLWLSLTRRPECYGLSPHNGDVSQPAVASLSTRIAHRQAVAAMAGPKLGDGLKHASSRGLLFFPLGAQIRARCGQWRDESM
jgi:hypothetical protein